MNAEILSIGDEVISGRILDTNAQWLAQRLEEVGVRVLYHTSVGDDLGLLTEAFGEAIRHADLVIATGGLGPTADDLTREALAGAVGGKLVLNPAALDHVRTLFARYKREMPSRNELQAWFPEGANMVDNPNGTAPGIDLEIPRPSKSACRVIALPGVPAEMREMWHGSVLPLLNKIGAGATRIVHKQVKCFGAGESQIESMLPDGFLRQTDPIVGINASHATMIFRVAAHGATEEACQAKIRPVVETIRQCLGDLVFGEDDDELQTVILARLRNCRRTLATAEWGTSGLVGNWLGACNSGGREFAGGLVATSEHTLQAVLRIDQPRLLHHAEGDDEELVKAMAIACRKLFAADYGLAVGRFPEAGPPEADPGVVHLALADADRVRVKTLPFALHPDLRRTYFAKQALNLVRLAMLEEAAAAW